MSKNPKKPFEHAHEFTVPSRGEQDIIASMDGRRLTDQFWTLVECGMLRNATSIRAYSIEHVTANMLDNSVAEMLRRGETMPTVQQSRARLVIYNNP